MPITPTPSENPDVTPGKRPERSTIRAYSGLSRRILGVICLACVVLAISDAVWGIPLVGPSSNESRGSRAPILLGIAAAIAILPMIRRIKYGDTEIELLAENVRSVKDGLRQVVASTGVRRSTEEDPHGSKSSRPVPAMEFTSSSLAGLPTLKAELRRFLDEHSAGGWGCDPNKGRFGGAAVRDGREITARAFETGGPKSPICRVRITVRALPGAPKLSGSVRMYLHPTFGDAAVQDLDVDDQGEATDEIVSAGAFTIGVVADGKTRLEYDLSRVPGATQAFRES